MASNWSALYNVLPKAKNLSVKFWKILRSYLTEIIERKISVKPWRMHTSTLIYPPSFLQCHLLGLVDGLSHQPSFALSLALHQLLSCQAQGSMVCGWCLMSVSMSDLCAVSLMFSFLLSVSVGFGLVQIYMCGNIKTTN